MIRLVLKAPAKLNLLLGITSDTVEGKHLLTSVFSTINLADKLVFAFDGSQARKITLEVISSSDIKPLNLPMEENIVYRAILAMEEFCHRRLDGHLHIVIEKSIPSEAGLAGGSTDAAATLKVLANLWDIDPFSKPVLTAARWLGADVTFFLYGGCALMGGGGEHFIRALPQPRLNLVLVKPEGGISTKAAYEAFDADPQEMPPVERLLFLLENNTGMPLLALARSFGNNLYPAAASLMPELKTLVSELSARPAIEAALITGSGSTVFGVCETGMAARNAARHFAELGYWTKACTTLWRKPKS
jgi:4-diphosphocytidyl-2-C-methyl-D-erythritol kinase